MNGVVRRFFCVSSQKLVKIVFVLGGPGSGKGTQCSMLMKAFREGGLAHPNLGRLQFHSVGGLLRDELKHHRDGTFDCPHAALIEHIFNTGGILPGHITSDLIARTVLREELEQEPCCPNNQHNVYLIDGFPRNADNVTSFEKTSLEYAKKHGLRCQVHAALHFTCSEEILVDRVLQRAHEAELNGLQPREDDTVAILRKRLETYKRETVPILEYYTRKQRLHSINADTSIQEVFKTTKDVFLRLLSTL